MAGKVAIGVTGVALTAGAIATAAALANEKNRYQAYQHRIGLNKGKKKTKRARSKLA